MLHDQSPSKVNVMDNSLRSHLRSQKQKFRINNDDIRVNCHLVNGFNMSSCRTTVASPRKFSQDSTQQRFTSQPQSNFKFSSRKNSTLRSQTKDSLVVKDIKQTTSSVSQQMVKDIKDFMNHTKNLMTIVDKNTNISNNQLLNRFNTSRPHTSKYVTIAQSKLDERKLLFQPENYGNNLRQTIDPLFGNQSLMNQDDQLLYQKVMNPHHFDAELTPFEVLKLKTVEDKRTKQEKQSVIRFLREVYPLSQLDEFNLEEIYKKLSTIEFNPGEVIKDYGEYPRETKARQIFSESAKYLQQNFFIFSQISLIRFEKICQENSKHSYFRRAGETVFLEGMSGDNFYIVRNGVFVSQKQVTIENQNIWPESNQTWKQNMIQKKVNFTANKIGSGMYFGEKELLSKKTYQINVCSFERGSSLIVIPRTELMKCFTEIEIDKIRTQPCITFPSEDEIRQRIQVLDRVVSMKKTAFLNATNTNSLPASLRDFYLEPQTKKLYKWVHGIESRTRQKLNQAIQQKEEKPKHQIINSKEYIDEGERDYLQPADDKEFAVVKRITKRLGKYAFKGEIDRKEQKLDNIAEGIVQYIIQEARNE
eukprot:403341070